MPPLSATYLARFSLRALRFLRLRSKLGPGAVEEDPARKPLQYGHIHVWLSYHTFQLITIQYQRKHAYHANRIAQTLVTDGLRRGTVSSLFWYSDCPKRPYLLDQTTYALWRVTYLYLV